MPFKRIDGFGQVGVFTLADGFAAFQTFQYRQFMFISFDQIGEFDERGFTFGGL